MTSVANTSPKRVVFVDALRVFAAIQMVQGHTIDALLAPAYRSGPIFDAWTFSRGLTSTAFLFAAGMSYVLATSRERDPEAGRKRRTRRALKLITIGYLMHAPVGILVGSDPDAAVREFLSVDVLQCIGLSLLLMELLSARFRARAAQAAAAFALGGVLLGAAFAGARLDPHGPWFPLESYLSVRGGSLFPLVPFGALVMFGLATGVALFRDPATHVARRLGLFAVLVTALGLGLERALVRIDPRVLPGQLLVKLGLVMAVSALLAFFLRKVERLWPWLSTLASETLFLYVSHVWLLYAAHVGLKAVWGSRLSPAEALLVALILLVFCAASALGYRRAERALRARWGGGR
jgi:uncharacterized membrane protein